VAPPPPAESLPFTGSSDYPAATAGFTLLALGLTFLALVASRQQAPTTVIGRIWDPVPGDPWGLPATSDVRRELPDGDPWHEGPE
jgi:hypothetical protein